MNANTWAKMPTAWIKHRGLARFPMGAPGKWTPALKLYIYLAGHACAPQPKIGATGVCAITYSQMVIKCGVGRGAIGPALDVLDPLVSRRSGKGREPNTYTVRDFPPNGGWAPLPIGYLVRGGLLERFGARSRTDLAALKLYLVLLAFRENGSGLSIISYEKITEYVAMTRNDVSRAGSLLIHHGMISVDPGRYAEPGQPGSETTPKRYRVSGIRLRDGRLN